MIYEHRETKVLNILFVEKINNFNSWNTLVIFSNLPFLNINLKASFFSDWTAFEEKRNISSVMI